MVAWTEHRLIEKIREASASKADGLLTSIGDDCCEVTAPGSFLISMDSLVEGVHFDSSFHPPHLLGRKSIAVNLSDIAAMGGRPRFVLLSLCLPEDLEWDWISSWLDGVFEILNEYQCVLIGGDTVKAGELVVTVTVLGEPPDNGAIYRNNAAEGDTVWVSGFLGSAGGGLKIASSTPLSNADVSAHYAPLVKAHLDPVPLIALGQDLAQSGVVTAMQDISDGLATDLAHICRASRVSATIDAELLPYLPELATLSQSLHIDLDTLILCSGEDYQLVFTVKKGCEDLFVERFCKGAPALVKIGVIGSGAGVFLKKGDQSVEISFQGYEH